jgi:hypothetical protein
MIRRRAQVAIEGRDLGMGEAESSVRARCVVETVYSAGSVWRRMSKATLIS